MSSASAVAFSAPAPGRHRPRYKQPPRGREGGIASTYNVAVIDDLKSLLGDRVSTAESVREHHSHGESWHPAGMPDAVVFPTTTEEVSAIVKVCARHGKPIVPFGMGSSLEGHVNAIRGGVSST